MLRGRILAKIARCGESCYRPPSLLNPWRFTVDSRALSLRKPFPFEPTLPKLVPTNDTDFNLIKKRFFNGGNNRPNEASSFSSKLLAAFGVLFGVCSGASAFHLLMNVNKDSIFGIDYFVACESENTCTEEPCVEKTCPDSVCLRDRTRECLEEKILRANGDLELALVDTKIKAIDYTEAAIEAYCEAMVYMGNYLDLSYNLLANDNLETDPCKYAETWCVVYKTAKKRGAKVVDALEKGQVAWELLCRLREVIESGKACQFTAANPLLCPVQEALVCAEKELLTKKTEMEAVYSDHPLAKKYKSGIESFRKELREDVYAKYDQEVCDEIKYVEQEMAMMIEQAYIRLIQVHKQWAKNIACKGWKRSLPPPPPSIPNFGETNPEDEICKEDDVMDKNEDADEGDYEEDTIEYEEGDDEEEMCEEEGDEEEICEEDEEGEEICEIVQKVNQEEKQEDPAVEVEEEEEDLSYEGPPLTQVLPPIPALPELPCAPPSPTTEEDENENEKECDCACDSPQEDDEPCADEVEKLEEDCEVEVDEEDCEDEDCEEEDEEEEECEEYDEEEE